MQMPAGRRLRFLLIALLSHRVPGVSILIGCGPRSVKPCGLLLLTGLQERSLLTGSGHDFSGVRPLNSVIALLSHRVPGVSMLIGYGPRSFKPCRIAVADRFAGAEFADRFWARFQWGQTTEQ